MDAVGPRYSMEEFARRGPEIYHRNIKPQLTTQDIGKFVAVDIETGDWEMDEDDYTAADRLLVRIPGAQMWLERVGYRSARSHGGRLPDEPKL